MTWKLLGQIASVYSTRSNTVGRTKRRETDPTGRQRLGEESQETRRTRGSTGISLAELSPARRTKKSAKSNTEFLHLLPVQWVWALAMGRSGRGVTTGHWASHLLYNCLLCYVWLKNWRCWYFIGRTASRAAAIVDVRTASLGHRLSDISTNRHGQLFVEIRTWRELATGWSSSDAARFNSARFGQSGWSLYHRGNRQLWTLLQESAKSRRQRPSSDLG